MSWLFWLLRLGLTAIGLCALIAAVLVAFPLRRPQELASIREGALAVDQSGLPNLSYFRARDGTSLAYRRYASAGADGRKIAILIHGSAGHSTGMNEIALRLAAENFIVVSPDVRGHGASGTRGDLGYYGQLDDDLQDLIADLRQQYPQARVGLLGFSSGGGFALRVAAAGLDTGFDRLVLLSPYLGYDAPSTRSPNTGFTWANVDIPRVVALSALRRLGLRCCEALPVIAFAVAPGSEKHVTAQYSYRLLTNFSPPSDLSVAFRRLRAPTTIIVGDADELMRADKYAEIVRGVAPAIDVKIVPGLHHMDMLHNRAAIDTISAAFSTSTR